MAATWLAIPFSSGSEAFFVLLVGRFDVAQAPHPRACPLLIGMEELCWAPVSHVERNLAPLANLSSGLEAVLVAGSLYLLRQVVGVAEMVVVPLETCVALVAPSLSPFVTHSSPHPPPHRPFFSWPLHI